LHPRSTLFPYTTLFRSLHQTYISNRCSSSLLSVACKPLCFSYSQEYRLCKLLWHIPSQSHGFYFPFSISPSTSSFCSSFFGVNIFNRLSMVMPSLGVIELITLKLSRLIVWF